MSGIIISNMQELSDIIRQGQSFRGTFCVPAPGSIALHAKEHDIIPNDYAISGKFSHTFESPRVPVALEMTDPESGFLVLSEYDGRITRPRLVKPRHANLDSIERLWIPSAIRYSTKNLVLGLVYVHSYKNKHPLAMEIENKIFPQRVYAKEENFLLRDAMHSPIQRNN